jgi:hypothetical protein
MSYFKSALITYTFTGNDNGVFTFNIQNQVNTDVLYDEIQVSYVAFVPNYPGGTRIFSVYVNEFQQYLTSFFETQQLWSGAENRINLEHRKVPKVLTLTVSDVSGIHVPQVNSELVIMLLFKKYKI